VGRAENGNIGFLEGGSARRKAVRDRSSSNNSVDDKEIDLHSVRARHLGKKTIT
jgi:hypothetical protein